MTKQEFMKSWFSKTPEFIHGDTENPLTRFLGGV